MSDYIHLFETQAAHDAVYNGSEYTEPWVGLVTANDTLSYNNPEYKLRNVPLTFEIIGDGDIMWKRNNSTAARIIEYKKNNGEWIEITSTDAGTTINVNSGDIVQFRGDNNTYSPGDTKYSSFTGTTAQFNLSGNIMSLLNSTNFALLDDISTCAQGNSYNFGHLFYNCTTLINACDLLLPATILSGNSYYYMFYGCTNLITAPKLPATTLYDYCYTKMFMNCTSLTTAPELPATTLIDHCYQYMFSGCTNLITAPKLSAQTLPWSCYENMFENCRNLSSITCLATNISGSYCVRYWLYGVSSTGIFTKAASMTSWPSGSSGIPSGWTVQDAS